jgi:hypothetical protein
MPSYKIEKDNIPRYKNFENLADAQNYANSLGFGFVATLENPENFPPFIRTLSDDMRFSKDLYDNFVQSNRNDNITIEESQQLISVLGDLKQLIDSGAVVELIELIQSLGGATVARVYTADRQSLDILKINSYIDSL